MSTKLYPDNHISAKLANHEELEEKKRNDMIASYNTNNHVVDRWVGYIIGNIDYRLERKQTRSIQHYSQKEVFD